MDILQIEHLTKTYGTGDTAVRALDDVSFTVAAGEFVAIIGSSGSGKSTLLHMIGGVDRPTSGTVRLNGEDVFQRSDEQLAVFRMRHEKISFRVIATEQRCAVPTAIMRMQYAKKKLKRILEPFRGER